MSATKISHPKQSNSHGHSAPCKMPVSILGRLSPVQKLAGVALELAYKPSHQVHNPQSMQGGKKVRRVTAVAHKAPACECKLAPLPGRPSL